VVNAVLHIPLIDFDLAKIWILTETLTVPSFSVSDFYVYHAPATQGAAGRPAGGVAVLIATDVPEHSLFLSGHNYLIIRLQGIFIVAAYFSPALPTADFIRALADILALVPVGSSVLLAGDFNARIDLCPLPPRTSSFLDLINSAGLWLCSQPLPLTFVAHQGVSTVDIFATSLSVESVSTPVAITGRSIQDFRSHKPVGLRLTLPAIAPAPSPPPKLARTVRRDLLLPAIAELQASPSWWSDGVDIGAALLVRALREAIPVLPPPSRTSQPWFNAECHRVRAFVMQARILMGMHTYMRPLYIMARRRYKVCLVAARAAWNTVYEAKMLAAAEAAPFKFGRRVGTRAVCPIPAAQMMDHFRYIAGGVNTSPSSNLPSYSLALTKDQTYWVDRANDLFTFEEIEQVIGTLPNGKAPGPDGLTYEHLKGSPEIVAALVHLYNQCLIESCFPSRWSDCVMVLIPKGKGDLALPSSWRGISKKSVLGKVLASLLARRLFFFF
jgi:hypothetical protein